MDGGLWVRGGVPPGDRGPLGLMGARGGLRGLIPMLALCAVAACGHGVARDAARVASATADSARADSLARARQDSINRAQPGYIIDSIFPIDVEIQRFKAAAGGVEVRALTDGAPSREDLVRQIVAAAVARDSARLARLTVTPREFVDLIYPSSPFARPPSQEAPGRIWLMIANPSMSGRIRLLRRLGGLAVSYDRHACDPAPEYQGANRLWTHCAVTLRAADGSAEAHRLFGTIVERDGRFKVMSFTNEF